MIIIVSVTIFIIIHVHEYTEYIRDVSLRNLRNVESSVRFENYILIEILEESEKLCQISMK